MSLAARRPPLRTPTRLSPRARSPMLAAGPRTAMLPPPDELSDANLLKIVTEELTDDEVNELVWKYLGCVEITV